MPDERPLERCFSCDDPTGHAGAGDGSLYDELGLGPYCQDCWDKQQAGFIANDGTADDLRRQLAEAKAARDTAERNAALAKSAACEAFVRGAKWWEYEKAGATMWQSDQNLALAAAANTGYPFTPHLEVVELQERAETAEAACAGMHAICEQFVRPAALPPNPGQALLDRLKRHDEVLAEVPAIIRLFHGEEGWDIYWNHAPEMKRLRAALDEKETPHAE